MATVGVKEISCLCRSKMFKNTDGAICRVELHRFQLHIAIRVVYSSFCRAVLMAVVTVVDVCACEGDRGRELG